MLLGYTSLGFCWVSLRVVSSRESIVNIEVMRKSLMSVRCLTVLLTTFYKREEQAQRISYLFVSAALSGGFGGL